MFGSRVLPSQRGHVGLDAAWETGEMLFLAWLCVGAEEASTVEGGRWRCVRIVCAASAGWVWRETTVDYAAGQRPKSTRCHEMIVLAAGDGSEQSQCIAYSSLRHASGLFVVELKRALYFGSLRPDSVGGATERVRVVTSFLATWVRDERKKPCRWACTLANT